MRGMAPKGKPRGTTGRQPTGIRPGEKASDYRQYTIRLPEEGRAELEATAGALHRPAWRVVFDAVRAYIGAGPGLSDDERRAVRAVLRLRTK